MRRLNLIENEITAANEFEGHENIEILELGKNKLKSTDGLANMPLLKVCKLYIILIGIIFIR